jgi:tRNA 2-thiouridine synthesizing protein A
VDGTRPRAPDQSLDLRDTPCPLNWVKAKLRLEAMRSGELLDLLVDAGDPTTSVSRTLRSEGHRVVRVVPQEGCVQLLVEKA